MPSSAGTGQANRFRAGSAQTWQHSDPSTKKQKTFGYVAATYHPLYGLLEKAQPGDTHDDRSKSIGDMKDAWSRQTLVRRWAVVFRLIAVKTSSKVLA